MLRHKDNARELKSDASHKHEEIGAEPIGYKLLIKLRQPEEYP
jgi:hypothetical protein